MKVGMTVTVMSLMSSSFGCAAFVAQCLINLLPFFYTAPDCYVGCARVQWTLVYLNSYYTNTQIMWTICCNDYIIKNYIICCVLTILIMVSTYFANWLHPITTHNSCTCTFKYIQWHSTIIILCHVWWCNYDVRNRISHKWIFHLYEQGWVPIMEGLL